MKKDRQKLNHEINLLYRQLGKEIVNDPNPEVVYTRKQGRLIKKIRQSIEEMTALKNAEVTLDSEAVILAPEPNENGIVEYVFCPQCHAGNNPKSTHCIRCNEPIK